MNRLATTSGLALAFLAFAAAGARADDFADVPDLASNLSSVIDAASQIAKTPLIAIYPVRGIDVSHYQGAIAWDQVRTDGLSFVYIKATEGDSDVDAEFFNNWQGAAGAGLPKGAYHFYDFCKDGASQAAHFLATVPPAPGLLTPVVDLEKSADCATMPDKAAFQPQLAAFVAAITAAYGRAPILYVNYQTYGLYLQGDEFAYKIWISDLDHSVPTLSSWTMWQYSFSGAIPGIPKAVDLDVFNGMPGDLAGLSTAASGPVLASR